MIYTEAQQETWHGVLMSGNNGETGTKNAPSESGYVDSMSDEELDELIQDLEDAQQPVRDKDGTLVVQGTIVQGQDHYLSSYRRMLEQLRTHRSKTD